MPSLTTFNIPFNSKIIYSTISCKKGFKLVKILRMNKELASGRWKSIYPHLTQSSWNFLISSTRSLRLILTDCKCSIEIIHISTKNTRKQKNWSRKSKEVLQVKTSVLIVVFPD